MGSIGITTFPTDYSIDIAVLAAKAEEAGFDSLWVAEHPVLPVAAETPWPGPGGVIPKKYADVADPFVALGRASAVTDKLFLGTGICLVPERNPLLLAKEVATLDMYAKGRFLFGIGAGWLKEETDIMGGDFARRWTQTKDSVMAMKELWTTVESEYHGKYYDFPPVYSFPRPVQRPHPPIYLGGHAKNVFKRVVSWGDAWMPNRISPDDIEYGKNELKRLCEESGRDFSTIGITVYGATPDPNVVDELFSAGAERIVLSIDSTPEKEALEQLNSFAHDFL
ncbi:MAG TPA: LLM class F420-dependent oxidoreductase [Dehalococcoidia bacterium]|nr:LLM class F420-dependent oxidoreductase [Chloroflexota bacterium]HCE76994.1 LLM class F420-dependent oxidoreductase [Dehalococcoidia bacterium]|tara:strand:- start:7035 stop:7877 length:843 start_codon:yes stop_codon:yes gene_type:complete